MAALWTTVTSNEGVVGSSFGVVADDSGAHYVFADGSGDWEGLDDARVAMVAEASGSPTDAAGWLALACANLLYVDIPDPTEAPDLEAAAAAAHQAIAGSSSSSGDSDWDVPRTRDDLVAFQRAASDAWSTQYPAVASGDEDDPEADLALQQLMTPPVDPTKPHRWLPIATTETDCGFCEQPEDAAIHQATTDTIARGAN